MLISKKWLQSHFTNELPPMQKIADVLLLHSFEIEGLEEKNGDWILDVDVLPNRAHDCLCHEGIAKELSGLLDVPVNQERYSSFSKLQTLDEKIDVEIRNTQQCYRYSGTLVKNIEVRESPEWLKNRMASMGQKSINALVDATNYIMFDEGQPMHVFDADKVVGKIIVRNAQEGERMTTLTGENLELVATDLVIADEEKILALAGVRGGKAAEVTADTKNIIIESANFHPTSTRKTARRVKILTDASKRYENGITSEKVFMAMSHMLSLVMELASTDTTQISEITDVYQNPEVQYVLAFTQGHTAHLLGFDISEDDINSILEKFNYSYFVENGNYKVSIPFERLDLRIPEDMIEEIGRIYGYHNIPTKNVDEYVFQPKVNKDFYVAQKLRNYFVKQGFTEIMDYTFVKKGELETLNPLASDKKALRKNLSAQMKLSLEKNARVADFIGVDQVLNFEIDRVHTKKGEELVCCFGIDTLSKKSRKRYGDEQAQIEQHIEALEKLFELEHLDYVRDAHVVSFSLNQLNIVGREYGDIFDMISYQDDDTFVGISKYPYVKRDISFWIEGADAQKLEEVFWNAGSEYLQKVFLFDEFEKDGKISYAFSLIFQSSKKTLTDKEVEHDMEKINKAVEDIGGTIR